MSTELGQLFLIATPIGNLEDMSFRAVKTLESVDYVLAEDTRHSVKLLNHFEISKRLVAYHEHNQYEKAAGIIEDLKKGQQIGLITDAGTPGISDPGSHLVVLCQAENIPYTIIPGPVALINGLVLSGQNTNRFIFEGFLPLKKKDRNERLQALCRDTRTIIFYEAPHKLKRSLKDIEKYFGSERSISFVRELTKVYEEVLKMSIGEAIIYYNEVLPKGEFVLVLEGLSKEEAKELKSENIDQISLEERMDAYMKSGSSKKEAIKQIALDVERPKREIYQYFLDK